MNRPFVRRRMFSGLLASVGSFTVVGLVAAVAVVEALAAGGAVLVGRRSGEVPTALRYLPVALVAGVLGLAGLGVLTFLEGAPHVAFLLVVTVGVPLGLGVGYASRWADLALLDAASVTAMAWGVPFLLGAFATFAFTVVGVALLDPGASGSSAPTVWLGAVGGGATTVAGTFGAVRWLAVRTSIAGS